MVINIRLFFPDIESDYNHINNPVGTAFRILLYFSSLFPIYSHFLIFITLSVTSPCSFQGADTDGEKICKAFGENFSTARLDGLKNFRQNPQGAKRPCRFLGVPSVASHPEPGKVELLTG